MAKKRPTEQTRRHPPDRVPLEPRARVLHYLVTKTNAPLDPASVLGVGPPSSINLREFFACIYDVCRAQAVSFLEYKSLEVRSYEALQGRLPQFFKNRSPILPMANNYSSLTTTITHASKRRVTATYRYHGNLGRLDFDLAGADTAKPMQQTIDHDRLTKDIRRGWIDPIRGVQPSSLIWTGVSVNIQTPGEENPTKLTVAFSGCHGLLNNLEGGPETRTFRIHEAQKKKRKTRKFHWTGGKAMGNDLIEAIESAYLGSHPIGTIPFCVPGVLSVSLIGFEPSPRPVLDPPAPYFQKRPSSSLFLNPCPLTPLLHSLPVLVSQASWAPWVGFPPFPLCKRSGPSGRNPLTHPSRKLPRLSRTIPEHSPSRPFPQQRRTGKAVKR